MLGVLRSRDMQNADQDTASPPFHALVGTNGSRRTVGIEVELGGLSPKDVASIAVQQVGGHQIQSSPAHWRIERSELGDLEIYLDTALAPEDDTALASVGVQIARHAIPVELVTPPVTQDQLSSVSDIIQALAGAGATGSRNSVLHGFGLHLNVELADPESGSDLGAVAQAFAVLEPWLRERDPLDLSRRVLPFTEAFPRAFVAPLCAEDSCSSETLFDLMDRHIRSRNHGLDLLPAYKALAPDRFARRNHDSGAVSARPAYHYRMPESRLGDPNWSLAYEWQRWCLVERIARDQDRLRALCGLWTTADSGNGSADYHTEVTELLGDLADLAPQMVSHGSIVEHAEA